MSEEPREPLDYATPRARGRFDVEIISDRRLYAILRVLAWVWFVPWVVVGGLLTILCWAGWLDTPLNVYTWPRMLKFTGGVLLVGAPGWGGIILTTRALRRVERVERKWS